MSSTLTAQADASFSHAQALSAPREQVWDFDEGSPFLFENARGVAVRECFGGYLQARADGLEPAIVGTTVEPVAVAASPRLVLKVRRGAGRPVSLVVNGRFLLQNAQGGSEISEDFALFSADLSALGEAPVRLTLGWSEATPAAAGDQIVIDWIRLLPPVGAQTDALRSCRTAGIDACLRVHYAWFRKESNLASLFIRNEGEEPVVLDGLLLDGREESARPWPLDPERRTHWFDFQPALLAPGEISQVRVSLRGSHYESPLVFTVTGRAGNRPAKAEHLLAPEWAGLIFTDLATSAARDRITFFLQSRSGAAEEKIAAVFFDQEEVTARCDLRGGSFFQGYAQGVLCLNGPLEEGSRHLIEAVTDQGNRACYRMRVLPATLLLGTYGIASRAAFEDYRAHGLNHHISFVRLSKENLDDLASLGMTGGSVASQGGNFGDGAITAVDEGALRAEAAMSGNHPGLFYYSTPDEPDCADYQADGAGSHARAVIGLNRLYETAAPSKPTFIQLDNTYRSKNYAVYAPAMDYAATHVYQLGSHFLSADRSAMLELRHAAQPNPTLWVTQYYPQRSMPGERVAYNGRLPAAGEMHLQMLHAVACGAKGILHYMHSGSKGGGGGAGRDRAVWDAMTAFHAQLSRVGPLIVGSTPVPWAASRSPGVEAQALLADAENLLLVVINHGFASTRESFSVTPAEAVAVEVALPAWLAAEQAYEIVPGGDARPFAFSRQGGRISLTLPRVEVGALFWITSASHLPHAPHSPIRSCK